MPLASRNTPSLNTITIEETIDGLNVGLFTVTELVKAYLARIEEINSVLNAITEVNPDALTIAAELDGELKKGNKRGHLHGVPILLKGNIGTSDKLSTTAGSYALLDSRLPRDANVVKKLHSSGAIILGKANMSQWGNARSGNSSNGWSAYGGQVAGVYPKGSDPWGSSSGSAVATATGLTLASLGTETAGSLASPTQANALCCIKPTVGLTSRDSVVMISEHWDSVGPIARSVKDCAYVLSAIAGPSPYDRYTSAIPFDTIPPYHLSCLSPPGVGLKGVNIGVPRNAISVDPIRLQAFQGAIEHMRRLGAIIVDPADYPDWERFQAADPMKVATSDFKHGIAEYFANLSVNSNKITNLTELIEFTKTHPLEGYPDRDVNWWLMADSYEIKYGSPEAEQAQRDNVELGTTCTITGTLDKYKLDAIILPVDDAVFPAAIAGSPHVTIPLGVYPVGTEVEKTSRGLINKGEGVMFGLSFLGRRWSEEKLIQYAHALEASMKFREKHAPYILPTVDLKDFLDD